MSTFSKFFHENIRPRTCQDLIHPTTCRQHLKKDILLYFLSNFKYFAPVCLLPALIKIRGINKEKLKKTLEYYLSCSVVGFCMGYTTNFLICLLRYICGQFGYYSFLFMPSFLAANILYLGPDRVINLYETTIFQCTFETFFLMRKNLISRTIANSRIIQTGLFMTCSAIILHAKQMFNAKGFWLLTPNPKIKTMENIEKYSKCELHPQISCKQYLFDGMRKYFILGLSLDIIKMLMSEVKPMTNQSKFMGKLKNFRIRSMALFAAYIGIYRFANCWFNSKHYWSNIKNHILSAFLAGSCYYLYPQSTLFSFALVQAIRSLWTIFEMSNIDSKNVMLKQLLAIPYARILYPFALGNMVHLLVMQPKYISHLAATVANGLTNNFPKHIQNEVILLQRKLKFERKH
ncbi:uncharacterized protein LOC111679080 [Lucilia cuprina]|uniref:uncharacterized protein LOC111679080 n=1 Tax=Lucilia cuprina TaxID=7375 RepID=UPI001F05E1AC|nr:uncharacterized protein LOC111679080 [Lucilia cuprina]